MKNYGLDQDRLQPFKALEPILADLLLKYEFDWYFTQNKIRPHESFIVRLKDSDARMIIIQSETILTPRITVTKSGFNSATGLSDQPDQLWLNVPVRSGVLKKLHDFIDHFLSGKIQQ